MSDEQPTSWRDRLFGSSPAAPRDRATDEPAVEQRPQHEGAAAPAADDAARSVAEHDERQPLVQHRDDTDTAVLDTRASDSAAQDAPAGADRVEPDRDEPDGDEPDRGEPDRGDSPIEPTVIAPSTLRGPSHSAAHPDDTARASAEDVHGEAADSSPERADADNDADARDGSGQPPELVEPRRPAFGLRRRSADADADTGSDVDAGAAADQPRPSTEGDTDASGGSGVAAGGLVAAGGAAAASPGGREFVEPEPTQAMDAHPGADATQPLGAQRGDRRHDEQPDDAAQTRVLDAQPDDEQRTQRFGIIRDEVPASAIPVDDETARAAARGGTPIVLVEEPLPPRRKGARGVGFAVALLATLIFAILFAAAFFGVGYLFDRAFDPMETLQTVWLRPSYLLPVAMFLLAYLVVTLIVNRAGWWAHVLGGFVVALLVYAAHIAGAFMEQQGGWAGVGALPGIDPQSLGQLLLAPLSVLAFVIAREVPIWVGGIVARRGRKAREWNRQALDDFNAENAERLAAYERARG